MNSRAVRVFETSAASGTLIATVPASCSGLREAADVKPWRSTSSSSRAVICLDFARIALIPTSLMMSNPASAAYYAGIAGVPPIIRIASSRRVSSSGANANGFARDSQPVNDGVAVFNRSGRV